MAADDSQFHCWHQCILRPPTAPQVMKLLLLFVVHERPCSQAQMAAVHTGQMSKATHVPGRCTTRIRKIRSKAKAWLDPHRCCGCSCCWWHLFRGHIGLCAEAEQVVVLHEAHGEAVADVGCRGGPLLDKLMRAMRE